MEKMFIGGGGHGGRGWGSFIWSDPDAQEKRKLLDRKLMLRVLKYARPYTPQIVLVLVMILATTFIGLLTPLIFRDLIDHALQPPGDADRLNLLALGMIAIPIINGTIGVVQRRLNSSIGEGVIYDLRVSLYSHLQRMSLRFFTNTKTGELMSRLNNDVIGAQDAITSTIVTLITNIVTVIAIMLVILSMEWRLTILGVLVLPFFVIVARRLGYRLRDIAREQMQYNAQMNAMMNETLNISGALLVKLFGRIGTETERFENRAGQVRDTGIKRAVLGAQFFRLVGMVSVVGTVLVYWVGGHLVLSGEFTVGTIVAFGTYLTQLYGPLQALTNAPVDFATSVVSFERVFEIIDLPEEIAQKPDAIVLDNVRGKLAFHDVSFKYNSSTDGLLSQPTRRHIDEGDLTLSGEKSNNGHASLVRSQAREQALNGISFTINPGEMVALVGPSGAGKTTMTYLIPRLYDPTSGSIKLDGHDLRDVTLTSLAENIGMVTQETYLFHDTIRQNLLYARLDANQEELETACKAANIHDFIAGLPNGYDTIVGERGYRLSGGEKQRIALARVILKNPRILVLDEATSSLDSQSEALIQDALAKVMQGRTSIVIAHRLSTVLSASRLFVLDRGEIIEQGTHAELLAKSGLYASLYETQFKKERQMIMSEPGMSNGSDDENADAPNGEFNEGGRGGFGRMRQFRGNNPAEG